MPASADRNMSNMATTINSIPEEPPVNQKIEKFICDGGVYTREEETVGANYTKVPSTKFMSNTTLVSVLLPDTVTTIDQHAVRGCTNLEYINLENIQTINDSAFRDSGINPVLNLPSLTTLGNWTFAGSKVQKVVSMGSITILSGNTFNACPNLLEVTLSDLITEIGASAMQSCGALTTVTILATTPPTIPSGLFNRCYSLVHIYVPSASVTSYQTASNWTAYASIISAIPS